MPFYISPRPGTPVGVNPADDGVHKGRFCNFPLNDQAAVAELYDIFHACGLPNEITIMIVDRRDPKDNWKRSDLRTSSFYYLQEDHPMFRTPLQNLGEDCHKDLKVLSSIYPGVRYDEKDSNGRWIPTPTKRIWAIAVMVEMTTAEDMPFVSETGGMKTLSCYFGSDSYAKGVEKEQRSFTLTWPNNTDGGRTRAVKWFRRSEGKDMEDLLDWFALSSSIEVRVKRGVEMKDMYVAGSQLALYACHWTSIARPDEEPVWDLDSDW